MKKMVTLIFGTALLLLMALPSQAAIIISSNPTAQYATVGSSVDVALVISGLTNGAAPSLSTFDLDVSFNSGILGFKRATFGDPVLGDQLDLFELGSLTSNTTGTGTVNLFELSFDLPSELNTLQAGSFILATLSFNALSVGNNNFGMSINVLGDALGDPLSATIQSGSITITNVPEPSSLLLLSIGIWFCRKFSGIKMPAFRRAEWRC